MDIHSLLKMKGVFAVGEFAEDGTLKAFAGEITEDEAAMAAAMCAANMHMAKMQADGFTALSGEGGWTPATGFSLAGPKFSVCVMHNRGVFVHNGKGSFNEIFKALSQH